MSSQQNIIVRFVCSIIGIVKRIANAIISPGRCIDDASINQPKGRISTAITAIAILIVIGIILIGTATQVWAYDLVVESPVLGNSVGVDSSGANQAVASDFNRSVLGVASVYVPVGADQVLGSAELEVTRDLVSQSVSRGDVLWLGVPTSVRVASSDVARAVDSTLQGVEVAVPAVSTVDVVVVHPVFVMRFDVAASNPLAVASGVVNNMVGVVATVAV